jgi:hypothetical protein
MSEPYLIWSNEHGAWWGPNTVGYVRRIEHAGRYSHEQALHICTNAMPGRRGDEPLAEIPVRLADLDFMLQRHAGTYPGHDPEPPAS